MHDAHDTMAFLLFLIPIVAIIMGVSIAMFGLYLRYRNKRDMFQLHHAERMAAIEKGIELPTLPPQFFQDTDLRESIATRNRRVGLILLFLGIGLAAALWGTGTSGAWWGIVPAAVGLAYLLSSLLEVRERK